MSQPKLTDQPRGPVTLHCVECGSESVHFDATAYWNVAEQRFVLSDDMCQTAYCGDCGSETDVVELPVTASRRRWRHDDRSRLRDADRRLHACAAGMGCRRERAQVAPRAPQRSHAPEIAAMSAPVMSPELRGYLQSYYTWATTGAPDGKPYRRRWGLCDNAPTESLWDELLDLLRAEFGELVAPFGGMDEYKSRFFEATQHENPARLAWLRRVLEIEAVS